MVNLRQILISCSETVKAMEELSSKIQQLDPKTQPGKHSSALKLKTMQEQRVMSLISKVASSVEGHFTQAIFEVTNADLSMWRVEKTFLADAITVQDYLTAASALTASKVKIISLVEYHTKLTEKRTRITK